MLIFIQELANEEKTDSEVKLGPAEEYNTRMPNNYTTRFNGSDLRENENRSRRDLGLVL